MARLPGTLVGCVVTCSFVGYKYKASSHCHYCRYTVVDNNCTHCNVSYFLGLGQMLIISVQGKYQTQIFMIQCVRYVMCASLEHFE